MSADPARMAALNDSLLDALVGNAQATRDVVQALSSELDQLHAEMAEIRDSVLALSNRIEAVTRAQVGSGLHSVKS